MALESNNAEMTKRLKYTKDILTHMLNNNTNKGSNVGGLNTATGTNQNANGMLTGKRNNEMLMMSGGTDIGGV